MIIEVTHSTDSESTTDGKVDVPKNGCSSLISSEAASDEHKRRSQDSARPEMDPFGSDNGSCGIATRHTDGPVGAHDTRDDLKKLDQTQ